jgi:hypothetical protein
MKPRWVVRCCPKKGRCVDRDFPTNAAAEAHWERVSASGAVYDSCSVLTRKSPRRPPPTAAQRLKRGKRARCSRAYIKLVEDRCRQKYIKECK